MTDSAMKICIAGSGAPDRRDKFTAPTLRRCGSMDFMALARAICGAP